MGRSPDKIVKPTGSVTVRASDDVIAYGPNTDESLTTDGLVSNQDIKILSGRKPFNGKVIRVIDDKIVLVIREFSTSCKWSKPFKAHISAIERT